MANNANINKVIYGNDTLIDLTSDTVTQADVLNSKSFHDASGTLRTGTADISGKADLTDLADAFSESTAYSIGNYVTYDGDLYRFRLNKTAGAWDNTKVVQITVGGEFVTKASLTDLADSFSTGSIYGIGKYITYNGHLYRFTAIHLYNQEWDESKVVRVAVLNDLQQARKDITEKQNLTSFNSTDFFVQELLIQDHLPQESVSLKRASSIDVLDNGVASGGQVATALNKNANPEMIAPTFSSSQAYLAGDYVTKQDIAGLVKLYQFTANHTGSWTGEDVNEVEVTTALNNKVDKVSGKGLSTNDYDNTAKGIVDNIQDNVKANTQLISESIWGESGKNQFDIGNTINDWFATLNNGLDVHTGNIADRVTATITPSTGSITVINYNTTGYWWMSKRVSLEKNTDYIFQTTSASTTIKLVGSNNSSTGTLIDTFIEAKKINSGNYDEYWLSIYPNDFSCTGLMIRDASILDPTYEPYHSSVKDTLRDAEVIQGKNWLDVTSSSKVVGGITYIVNADKSITANGTQDGTVNYSDFYMKAPLYADAMEDINKYPSDAIYSIGLLSTADYTGGAWYYDASKTYISGQTISNNDSKIALNIPNNAKYIMFFARIQKNKTVSNVVFKPMVCTKEDWDKSHEHEPYYIPLKDSCDKLLGEFEYNGASNILEILNPSKSENGISFILNTNKSVTIFGASTDNAYYKLNYTSDSDHGKALNAVPYRNQKLFVSLGANTIPDGVVAYVGYYEANSNTYQSLATLNSSTPIAQITVPNTADKMVYQFRILSGKTVSVTLYPSISVAMTNKELTDKAYNTSDTAETTIADADYFPFYDTSATGKRKTLWSTIKSVLKTYFDSLYNKYLENNSVVLSTSTTTDVTFTDASITANSVIDFACTVYDLVPDNMTATTGSCTVTLPKVDSAMTVGVRLYIRS